MVGLEKRLLLQPDFAFDIRCAAFVDRACLYPRRLRLRLDLGVALGAGYADLTLAFGNREHLAAGGAFEKSVRLALLPHGLGGVLGAAQLLFGLGTRARSARGAPGGDGAAAHAGHELVESRHACGKVAVGVVLLRAPGSVF